MDTTTSPPSTTDQTHENSLPSIESFLNPPIPQHLIDLTESHRPQEYEDHPINYDEQINCFGLVNDPIDNPNVNGVYSVVTYARANMVPSIDPTEQHSNASAEQIQIKYQPRQHYHPRTQKECEKVSHYIHGEGEDEQYPAIYISPNWASSSEKNGTPSPKENWIEVGLMTVNNQPHPYLIDNKQRNLPENKSLIWRNDDENLLYFRVTETDFTNGFKSLMIQIIKSKQDNNITKQLIQDQQLDKSKFRFRRTFLNDNGTFSVPDEASTIYSNVMTEKYSDVTVTCINPQYGPIGGNQRLDVVCTGFKAKEKEKVSFKISEQTTGWAQQITNYNSTGNILNFSMPAFPYPRTDSVQANVIVYYDGHEIFNSPYIYVIELDAILNRFGLNNSSQVEEDLATSKNNFNDNQDLASNLCSSSTVPKTTSKKNVKKRKRDD